MLKKYIIVFLISMVPLIELRGAIPYAVGFELPIWPSCLVAVLGNMLPVPFIFLFARRILEWGKDKKVIGDSSAGAWKRETKPGSSWSRRPDVASTSHCCFSWAYLSPAPVHGQALWRPVS